VRIDRLGTRLLHCGVFRQRCARLLLPIERQLHFLRLGLKHTFQIRPHKPGYRAPRLAAPPARLYPLRTGFE